MNQPKYCLDDLLESQKLFLYGFPVSYELVDSRDGGRCSFLYGVGGRLLLNCFYKALQDILRTNALVDVVLNVVSNFQGHALDFLVVDAPRVPLLQFVAQ